MGIQEQSNKEHCKADIIRCRILIVNIARIKDGSGYVQAEDTCHKHERWMTTKKKEEGRTQITYTMENHATT